MARRPPSQRSRSVRLPIHASALRAGLNFFLVDRAYNRGYWVGPMHPQAGFRIDLLIEKYAGLSSANLSRE
jgi:hypothetical protein